MELDSEPDTPAQGTDNAQTQADDTANDWDFYDPGEEQDTVETPQDAATDDGAETTEEAVSTEATDEPEEIEASADAVVSLPDGSKVKVSELIQGQLRQADYSRKTQELANERTAIKADVERIEGITQALVDHLSKLVPAMPDHTVALRDPGRYTRERVMHEAAMAQLQALSQEADKAKTVAGKLSQDEMNRRATEEGAKLTERFPEIAQPQARQKFLTEAVKAAAEFGVTIDDLQTNPDHRIFAALHYAAKGLAAEKAMQAAKAKAEKAPPMATQKPSGPQVAANRREAMRKIAGDDSIENILRVLRS